jgi:hypothetical protein
MEMVAVAPHEKGRCKKKAKLKWRRSNAARLPTWAPELPLRPIAPEFRTDAAQRTNLSQ